MTSMRSSEIKNNQSSKALEISKTINKTTHKVALRRRMLKLPMRISFFGQKYSDFTKITWRKSKSPSRRELKPKKI